MFPDADKSLKSRGKLVYGIPFPQNIEIPVEVEALEVELLID